VHGGEGEDEGEGEKANVKLIEIEGLELDGDDSPLRQSAATALEQGLRFVEAHGDELARLRTHALLQAGPIERALAAVEARQQGDGSYAPLGLAAGGAPGLAEASADGLPDALLGTLEALITIGDLAARAAKSGASLQRAAEYLESAQLEDGSWGAAASTPESRIFATGMLAGYLGRTRIVRQGVLIDAGEFMGEVWHPDLIAGRSWPLLTSFGCFFCSVEHEESDAALQWIGRELEKGYRSRSYDANETLRSLLHCDAMAIPGTTLDPAEMLGALVDEQASDGGYAQLSGNPPAGRVTPTIDAMLAMLRLCTAL
jgi:hypothetical protein